MPSKTRKMSASAVRRRTEKANLTRCAKKCTKQMAKKRSRTSSARRRTIAKNPWLKFVESFRRRHPELKHDQALLRKKAAVEYRSGKSGSKKRSSKRRSSGRR